MTRILTNGGNTVCKNFRFEFCAANFGNVHLESAADVFVEMDAGMFSALKNSAASWWL